MNKYTKIRKMPPSNLNELSQILEYNDSWKKLMAAIPITLDKDNFECKITERNRHRYHSEHFKLIEAASIRTNRLCSEILFDEWARCGRVTPALGHLLFLLTKSELFRAADYVAVTILKIQPPDRPAVGPAARVRINLGEEPNTEDIERILNEIDYPSSVINTILNNGNSNVQQPPIVTGVPEIVISEVPETNQNLSNMIPLVIQTEQSSEHSSNGDVSDMIKFSQTQTSPKITDLLLSSTSEITSQDSTEDGTSSEECEVASSTIQSSQQINDTSPIPPLTDLMLSSSDKTEGPAFSALLHSKSEHSIEEIIPNLSILNVGNENASLPLMSSLASQANIEENTVITSDDGPQFSALLPTNKSKFLPVVENAESSSYSSNKVSSTNLDISPTSSLTQNSNSSSSSRATKCASPLPNLSLNTLLPHFSYYEIETATNNFDKTPHKNCKQIENSLAHTNGRFLGSGAFGSVFLSLGLCGKPVAVKKLYLNNVDVVNIDDSVTIQFKNEVEVLSKYKHDNLLSLVGYSCDGPTYCLLYEFIPGGALKDRLQNLEDELMWIDRLHIALGTARAVAYLHTAYKTPLIHRDIKTANILLDCSSKPKLCDFGLIKLIPSQNTNTKTSAFGTSAYMAREAFRGDVSVKLDTFSFGVVLLELITGLPPLDENREGCDIVTHVEEICDESIAPLVDSKAGDWLVNDVNYAEELYSVSLVCLEENKKKRPTMVEVSDKLAKLVSDAT